MDDSDDTTLLTLDQYQNLYTLRLYRFQVSDLPLDVLMFVILQLAMTGCQRYIVYSKGQWHCLATRYEHQLMQG